MTLLNVLQTKAKELRLLASEVGVAFDANGSVVIEKKALPGEEYELEFTEVEIVALRNIGDVIFLHSHPRLRYDRIEE